MLQLKIIAGTAVKEDYEEIESIDQYKLTFLTPENFDGESAENVFKKMDMSFEYFCASLEEAGVQNPKQMTTFEFYSRVNYYRSKNKKP